MWGAFAISWPSRSNSAQEKSSRSLMFTELAVLASVTPICSAMAMNRLLKISSSTGSARVDAEARFASPIFSSTRPLPFAAAEWATLARHLPPATSAMSIMAVPLVGTLSATFIVGEWPHWQDYLAIVFVMAAIGAVLMPARGAQPAPTA